MTRNTTRLLEQLKAHANQYKGHECCLPLATGVGSYPPYTPPYMQYAIPVTASELRDAVEELQQLTKDLEHIQ